MLYKFFKEHYFTHSLKKYADTDIQVMQYMGNRVNSLAHILG